MIDYDALVLWETVGIAPAGFLAEDYDGSTVYLHSQIDDPDAGCGHFHDPSESCPDPSEPCGSYLCCIN